MFIARHLGLIMVQVQQKCRRNGWLWSENCHNLCTAFLAYSRFWENHANGPWQSQDGVEAKCIWFWGEEESSYSLYKQRLWYQKQELLLWASILSYCHKNWSVFLGLAQAWLKPFHDLLRNCVMYLQGKPDEIHKCSVPREREMRRESGWSLGLFS